MATYISAADGNFTAAATWVTVETGTSAVQSTVTSSNATTTSYVYSSAFTGTNTNVCDGIMLYCIRVNTTGTVAVTLSEDNGTTATREVTVNASDLPATASWVFFKFGSTLTLDGGTDYKVGIKGSSAGNATFYRDGTANNWARYLRLTTAASSLAAADVFFIVGEYTAAATYTARTVTMDSTATTQYGTVYISPRGTLQYGTSASTNYNLTLAGDCVIYDNGTLNIGTSGTPMPRTSTAVLEFVCASAAQYGLLVYGTCNAYGQSRTSGKDIYYCRLSVDASASATSLTVDTDTGWLNGDQIALAPTARTYSQYEDRTLNANATTSGLSVSSGLTNAHSGTSPTQGEIINLTRNVKIRANASAAANATYIRTFAASTVNLYWVELYYFGQNAIGKYGIDVGATSSGAFNMLYCSLHDWFYYVNLSSSTYANVVIRYNSWYKVGTSGSYAFRNATTSGSGNVFSNNILIGCVSSGSYCVYLTEARGTTDSNVISGAYQSAFTFAFGVTSIGSFANNVAHSNNSYGLYFETFVSGVIDNITVWRNNNYGYYQVAAGADTIEIKNSTFFGNTTANMTLLMAPFMIFNNVISYSEASYATSSGVMISIARGGKAQFIDCQFSPAGKTAHTYDVNVLNSSTAYVEMVNCLLGASTEVTGQSNLSSLGYIASSKHDQTSGAYKTWRTYGTISRDTTFYKTAAPSERLTPTDATGKLPSGSRVAGVDNGGTLTVSVYIRKSASGDGAAYNGNQPRLMVKRNDAVGITTDTVLATYASGTGSWVQISGTTAAVTDDGALEFYVDCDGTAGWINVDDWSVT